jgi:ribonuclease J
MQIKVHRGTHQIGGTVTEIKTDKARLIIDMGYDLPSAERKENTTLDIDGVTSGTPNCDAVLITHYHGDHVGAFESVLAGIPIYMGHIAKQVFATVQRVLKTKLDKGNPERVDEFKTFESGKPLWFGDIKVTPVTVDHSAFDAYMLLIEADGKRVLHTGDFRMHGARGRKMPLVFETFAKNIDVLITEGTMMSRRTEKVLTEHEMGRQAKELLRDNKHVFVLCSSTNIDSIAEFYSAAIANKRVFVVCEDDFQNEILRIITENSKSSFYDFSRKKVYTYSRGEKINKYMDDSGFCFIGRTNFVTGQALQAFPDNLLIYSMWKGYLDKKHPAFDQYKSDFIDKAIVGGSRLVHLHTSGHATAEQIKQVCEITKAKVVLPIHSEQPEAFLDLGIIAEIKVLQDGEAFEI